MKTSSIESQLAGFLEKYDPEIESQLREARTRLRAMFPRGFELVFDNHNALVFAISTDRFLVAPTSRRSSVSTGQRSIWLMNGTALTSGVYIPSTSVQWEIRNR